MLRLLRLPPTYFFTVLDVVLDDIFDDDFLDDGTKYFGICFYYILGEPTVLREPTVPL